MNCDIRVYGIAQTKLLIRDPESENMVYHADNQTGCKLLRPGEQAVWVVALASWGSGCLRCTYPIARDDIVMPAQAGIQEG